MIDPLLSGKSQNSKDNLNPSISANLNKNTSPNKKKHKPLKWSVNTTKSIFNVTSLLDVPSSKVPISDLNYNKKTDAILSKELSKCPPVPPSLGKLIYQF